MRLWNLLGLALLVCRVAHAGPSVEVERTASGDVVAHFRLVQKTTSLTFAVESPLRTQRWSSNEPSIQLRADRAVSDRALLDFKVKIAADLDTVDRGWPELVRVNATSSLLDLDYLRVSSSIGVVRFELRNAYDPVARRCLSRLELKDDIQAPPGRFVLLSATREDCVALAGALANGVVADPEAPAQIVKLITETLRPAYQRLGRRFGAPEPAPPLAFLAYDAHAKQNDYKASTGTSSMILFQFRGAAWSGEIGNNVPAIRTLVAHEVVHLWIGGLISTHAPPGSNAEWLHEGAAEYIAATALAQERVLSKDDYLASLSRRLESCLGNLGSHSLMSERAPASGSLVYDCGVLVQFAYDLASRASSGGTKTVIDVWKGLLPAAPTMRREIAAHEFIDARPDGRRVVESVLSGPDVDADAVLAGLRRFGVMVVREPNPDANALRMAALQPVLRADCEKGPFGFRTLDDHLELDANSSCRRIPDRFAVRYIEDVDAIERPQEALRAAAQACAQGGLRLAGQTNAQPTLTLPCAGRVVQPTVTRIQSVPFLAD